MLVLGWRFFSRPILQKLGFQTQAGLQVMTTPSGANMYLDGRFVGTTPYHVENLEAGDYRVGLLLGNLSWQGKVYLSSGTLSVINRDLQPEATASSGEALTLTVGRGVDVTSLPVGASVEVDGKETGKTPLFLPDLSTGEHVFLLSRQGYLTRSIRALLPANLTLNIAADLAMQEPEATPVLSVLQITVKPTSPGFLRVRQRPSISSPEIGRVKPGDTMPLLGEVTGWVKVRLPDGSEGYLSADYVQKSQ